MLGVIDEVVSQYTADEERSINAIGQIKEGIKLQLVFDKETRDFISLYFKQGKKKEWLDQVCFISFQLGGEDKEMILYASEKCSKIDVELFPSSVS